MQTIMFYTKGSGRPTKFTVDEELYLEQAAVALQVSESSINTVTSSFFSLHEDVGCTIINQWDAQSCKDLRGVTQ